MTMLQTVNLGPMLSSRRLIDIERRLVPVACDLADMLERRRPDIPNLPDDASGYRFFSCPAEEAPALRARLPGMVAGLERHHGRRYIDMAQGFDAYMAEFSGRTRSTLRRKCRKFAQLSNGKIDIRGYHGADDIERFFDLALPLSARTYQDRLLDAGLPCDTDFRAEANRSAAQDDIRAFLLFVNDRPVAYLYLPATGGDGRRVLRYDYLGYDPEFAPYSPGTVLQLQALETLMAEDRFAWFDFTGGDGAHKTMFGRGELKGVDFVMLRDTLANRFLLGALDGVERMVAHAGQAADRLGIRAAMKKRLRRG